jgi:hypothetical protein
VHSDGMMAPDGWTAILYLTKNPPTGDGTIFWKDREGLDRGPFPIDAVLGRAPEWEKWQHVEARFNRLLIFKSDLYHSRAIAENYGTGDEARLIQVVFGRGEMP